MNIISWNVRGLNKPHKIQEVGDFIHINKPDVIALVENKLKDRKTYKSVKNIRSKAHFRTNNSEGSEGRILLAWNNSHCDVKLVNYIDQLMTCICKVLATNNDFVLIVVYAKFFAKYREKLLEHLVLINSSFEGPWLVTGDFSFIRYNEGKRGGNIIPSKVLAAFNKCLSECSLDDIKSSGATFTWSNEKEGLNHNLCKSDRHLCNKE